MESIIIVLAQIVFVVLIFKWFSSLALKNQFNQIKKDPRKFLDEKLDKSVRNKERILREIEKFEEIVKIDYWKWGKDTFKDPKKAARKESSIEVLIKTTDGQEQWYVFHMKNKKLTGLEKTYKPVA